MIIHDMKAEVIDVETAFYMENRKSNCTWKFQKGPSIYSHLIFVWILEKYYIWMYSSSKIMVDEAYCWIEENGICSKPCRSIFAGSHHIRCMHWWMHHHHQHELNYICLILPLVGRTSGQCFHCFCHCCCYKGWHCDCGSNVERKLEINCLHQWHIWCPKLGVYTTAIKLTILD